jgi:3-oxoacyl-[acyl-carrier protein] reductase
METSEFQDKVALVTGASSGIGSAIATRLGRAGATVAVHYNSHEENAAVASTITSAGGTAFIVGGDVAKVDDAKSIVKAVVDRCGEIDILVNCAGILEYARFGDIDSASFERQFSVNTLSVIQFSVNTLSVILMMQAAAPHFPASGGRVVNVSSNIAFRPIEGCSIYCASKAAVSTLTEAFSKELASKRITVNAVAPGATVTPMTAWLTDDLRRGIEQATPLARMAVPADIADVVFFLASDGSRWVTGRTILVDGGLN